MQTSIGSHCGDDALEQYALGHLSEDLNARVEQHLLICETCQTRLTELEDFIEIESVAAAELRAEESNKTRTRFDWAGIFKAVPTPVWAGALAALVLITAIPFTYGPGPGTSTEVSLQALRGAEQSARVRRGKVVLNIEAGQLPPSPNYQLQLADSDGQEVWKTYVQPAGVQIRAEVPLRLSPGKYWVRIYNQSGSDLLREFGLDVR